jgi:hypothetical protein
VSEVTGSERPIIGEKIYFQCYTTKMENAELPKAMLDEMKQDIRAGQEHMKKDTEAYRE